MDRRVFPIRTYVTLTWQVLLFSMAATLLLDRFIESRLIWALPVIVLVMSVPYIVRVVEIIGDRSQGRRCERTMRLVDVSREFAVAIHSHRGMMHWTLIFEDEADGSLYSLTAAATKEDARAMWRNGERYSLMWLDKSRVILEMESAR
ncbi:MAG: hypothetical protein PUG91_10650 [Clostridiales bacterium]|nr:hypothetical protein [Clostridiales bacterium]MDY2871814.1 hypothetical protein [Eubacteriales bacterium]